MAKREKVVALETHKAITTSYFTDDKENLQFVSTGCTLLDCALGGGYCLGRITNLVGDKSTAKTGLSTEALINFIRAYPNGGVAYRESEAAFDFSYAQAMGLPINKVDFGDTENPLTTVEDFARDLSAFVDQQTEAKQPGIYILDSLDALSDDDEMENDIGKASFGMKKAKTLSILFRTMARRIEKANVLVIIVSQVRDNINAVAFGEKTKRSGGRALDFYASQVVWLAHIRTLKKTIKGVERPYGIMIRAKIKKNKVGLPMRECDFSFLFGFGVEDIYASVDWLKEVNRLEAIGTKTAELKDYLKKVEAMDDAEYAKERQSTGAAVKEVWREIETTFLPSRAKYSTGPVD